MATLTKPTPAELRAIVRLQPIWEAYGLATPPTSGTDQLQEEIVLAWAYVESKTGIDLDIQDDSSTIGIIGRRAVILRTVQQAVQFESGYLDDVAQDLVKSFSVPGYSETRADQPTKLIDMQLLNPWPELHSLLWEIATPAKKEEALALARGDDVPYSTMTEIDWELLPFNN